MIAVVADACAVIAAYDETHPDSEACAGVLDTAPLIVISPLVLDEVDHLAVRDFGYDAACWIAEEIQRNAADRRYLIPEITTSVLAAAAATRSRYTDLKLDLPDAVTVALAAQLGTNTILTVDRRDFRAMRPLEGPSTAFRLLPDDA